MGISSLKTRDFRVLADQELHFDPRWNYFCGANAQGKTSILEAIAVLMRLQSPRTRTFGDLVRFDARGLVLDGWAAGRHMQFYHSTMRRKLALDGVEQQTAAAYLELQHVVFFSNEDVRLIRGTSTNRRAIMDFLGTQLIPGYRHQLRNYIKALRSRNRLLKDSAARWREIEAYEPPLCEAGQELIRARHSALEKLHPLFQTAVQHISGGSETDAALRYFPSAWDFSAALEAHRDADRNLGQTTTGPHRDDLQFLLYGRPAAEFASEGQQRTLVLAVKNAEALLLSETKGHPPVLLMDDIFGELDANRRRAVLEQLPDDCQRFLTSTSFDWLERPSGPMWKMDSGRAIACRK